ncbi:MAG: TIGR02099 family protein [Gammaproteobacteria bacterium]|nr:TIGR02099 family protein [Gammaproteobacteria bacterium]
MTNLQANKGSTIYRFVWVSAWYAFAAVVVLVATLFAAARLLLPYADQYSVEIGERLSNYLEQPVLVRALDAEWDGWGPSLVLRDAALLDAMGEHPVLRLEKIRLGFDLFDSVRQWQPIFSHITLVGVDLVLTRSELGEFSVEGVSAGNSEVERKPEDTARVMAWLFSQGRLGLENSNITWRDEMGAGRVMHFSAVNVSLRNDDDRHQLDASLALPRNLGKSLVLRVDMYGNPLQATGRRTQLYLAGEHVHLTELFETQSLAGVGVSAKSASFQVWAGWKDGQLQQLKGNADAGGVALMPAESATDNALDKKTLLLDRVAADFDWQKMDKGWQFEANDLLLARQSRQWQPSRVSLTFMETAEADAEFNVYASFLQLEDVTRLLSLFSVGGEAVQKALLTIKPRGEIRDAEIIWQAGDIPRYRAYARLQTASVNAWRAVPAAQKIDGQLWVDSDGGQVALQRAAMTLDFPNLFRWPITVNELRGNVAWQQKGKSWRVIGRKLEASNKDISASATLDVVQDDAKKSPFMSLLVDFRDGDGSQVARYLPTGMMSPNAVSWLDEAIVGAHIISGGTLFHGRLDDFPFDQGNGRFEVSFAAENASLNYAENWPPITDITANVHFLGRSMSIVAKKGKIFSNNIQWAKVSIADMTATPIQLNIEGEVQGSTQEKLDYLVASPPLYTAFAEHLKDMEAKGSSLLNLNLSLPIGNDEPVQVNGWLTMKENTLSIPPLGQVLSDVGGRLDFSRKGLRADNIQADLFGQTTQINITTDETRLNPKVRIRARGMFDAPNLAARYLPPAKKLLAGKGDWNISFDIPLGGEDTDTRRVAVLQMRTNLKGVEARLPPPFDKTAEDAGSLELRVDFPPKQLPVLRVNYDGFVDGIFALGDVSTGKAPLDKVAAANSFRGEVRLNGGAAKMPTVPGLRLSGWLDTVSLDDWRNLQLAEPATNDASVPLFNSADIAVRKLELYGQQLHNVRFKLAAVKDALQADIDSKELKGRILLPHKGQDNPIRADLDYCYLSEVSEVGGAMDPRAIPALDFHIADFRYKNSKFGSMRLETARVADGVRIEQLVLKPRSTTITARGGWYVRGKQQYSNLQMHVESRNIGHTLKALDYVGGINKGKGSADLELKWPGSFTDVDASNIQGKMNLSLKDGYLLDVDPGAGRMFGMLSIQALPRRLLLDFSDVFKKGFGFDRIRGSFTIEDGDAYTNNLYMDGPAARVEIAGRTGLAEQDYDQLVTVTPHVADSLPMLGILAATPQVGAAILAFQKIFQPQIDDATKNQYTITGSWNEPVIKKVKSSGATTDNFDEDES